MNKLKNTLDLFSKLKKAYCNWRKDVNLKQKFYDDLAEFETQIEKGEHTARMQLYPCLYDATGNTEMGKLYFLQDNWAFERIFKEKPKKHIDIGSHHIFVSLMSKVVPVTMVDIRPLSVTVDSLTFVKGTILELPFESKSIASLSSLCVIEHIGLGRYGDPIDPDGSVKAIAEINRVLCTGAHFYFSVPVEKENKVYFNAHRSFSESFLFNLLDNYEVIDKMYIYDREYDQIQPEKFGVGCYHVVKN